MKHKLLTIILFILPIFYTEIHLHALGASREDLEKSGTAVWEVKTKKKIVAITFDDGPHPVFTPQILDKLAKYQAKATFFVTGFQAKQYPDLIKREVEEGHEIANHTYRHFPHKHLTARKLTKEMEKTDHIIKGIIGYKPYLFRPVGGHYDHWIIKTAKKNGKLVVLWTWNQDSRDWEHTSASEIYKTIIKGLKPGNIILFHDWHGSTDKESFSTVRALDHILDYLEKHGYKCVTVSELLYQSVKNIPDDYEILPLR